MAPPDPRASRPHASRAARVLLGVFFLFVAAASAWWALARPPRAAALRVTVRVLDAEGRPLPGAEVRTRYGGDWVRVDAAGEVRLESPRVREGQPDPGAALADALEARGTYHRLRRDRHARVTAGADGAYAAEFRLEHCGLLRIGVAMTAYASARATLDPDAVRDRWRVVEGNDVVRAGQAATWAVFPGAPRLWATLEGDRGVAQERVPIEPPGPGFLLERTLFPHASRPIRGRLVPEGGPAATLEGVLDVTEFPEGAEPVPRLPVKIEPDGSFQVDYAGEGAFRLEPHCAFAAAGPVDARGGDEDVRLPARALPWIEVTRKGPTPMADAPPAVSLWSEAHGDQGLVAALARGGQLLVPVPGPGEYAVTLVERGSDATPPRSGRAGVSVGAQAPARAELLLVTLPHGTVVVEPTSVPARGGTVRVLPDRERTLLPRAGERATFEHVPVGRTYVDVRWHDPALARSFAVAEVRAGATATIAERPEPGAAVEFDVSGTPAAEDAATWALHLPARATPYGEAEGTVALRRTLVEGAPALVTEGALRPGPYRARLHPTRPDGPAPLEVAFEVVLGRSTRVAVGAR